MKRAVMHRDNNSMRNYLLIALLVLVAVLLLVSIFSRPDFSPSKLTTKKGSLTVAPSESDIITKSDAVPVAPADEGGGLRGVDFVPVSHNYYCYGDVDRNGYVNPGDRGFISANIGRFFNNWETFRYDLNGDGFINPGDRGFVSANINESGCDIDGFFSGLTVKEVREKEGHIFALTDYNDLVVFNVDGSGGLGRYEGSIKKINLVGSLLTGEFPKSFEVSSGVGGLKLYTANTYLGANSFVRIYGLVPGVTGSAVPSVASLISTLDINQLLPGVSGVTLDPVSSYYDDSSKTLYVAFVASNPDYSGVYVIDVRDSSNPIVSDRILGLNFDPDWPAKASNILKGGDGILSVKVFEESDEGVRVHSFRVYDIREDRAYNPMLVGVIQTNGYYQTVDERNIVFDSIDLEGREVINSMRVYGPVFISEGNLQVSGIGTVTASDGYHTVVLSNGQAYLVSRYLTPIYNLYSWDLTVSQPVLLGQSYFDFGIGMQTDNLGSSVVIDGSDSHKYYVAFGPDGVATFRLD